MKKILIFISLFSFVSYSQTYNDVMSINSEKMFLKVVIENGYEFDSTTDNDWITYGFNIVRDSIDGNKSTKWSSYNIKDDRFYFGFSRNSILANFLGLEDDNSENLYDKIVEKIKNNCKYFDIIKYKNSKGSEQDYVCYSCSDSKYKGKIGFMISEGWGVIRHFPNN